jgi:hypothetical protein
MIKIVSASVSQAAVEGIFSVCDVQTAGRRSRMDKSLKMRVFLKLLTLISLTEHRRKRIWQTFKDS